jgi:hypothetical protein
MFHSMLYIPRQVPLMLWEINSGVSIVGLANRTCSTLKTRGIAQLTRCLVTPKGQSSQLGCIKHVFTNGFTVGITEYALLFLPYGI